MPVISMYYGIIVMMYYFDNRRHHHRTFTFNMVRVVSIPDGMIIEGSVRANKMKLVQAWIEIHQDELMANWQLAVTGQRVFKIEPLK